ncbi:MAG TPA: phosphoribosylglycinamide formyltransferase [Acidimicrobiales bacterium]|nr:phosphoribosylglycinamide formyltransferase [Acidimicrobiales bacterium]
MPPTKRVRGRPAGLALLGAAGTVPVVRIGVLASGSGTILEAILAHGIPVSVVIVDRPCRASEVAERAGVAAKVVRRGSFGADFDRLDYTHRIVDALEGHGVELVVMAGFGTVLDKPVHDAFPGRVLNTHPALLPAFPGWHAVEQALAAGVKVTGCTVHLATLEVDAGPILAQEAVPVLPGDTAERLHERIKTVERELYPRTIRAFVDQAADR